MQLSVSQEMTQSTWSGGVCKPLCLFYWRVVDSVGRLQPLNCNLTVAVRLHFIDRSFLCLSRTEGEMCGQPGVRDSHPQTHDATLHQPPAQTPPARPVRAERDG